LLVRHPDCTEAAAFDNRFDRHWEVSSLKDLAEKLEREGWLRVFLVNTPLDPDGAELAIQRLRRLKDAEHRYSEALDLSSRIQLCDYFPTVSAQRRREVERAMTDLYRHLGLFEKAEQLARKEVKRSLASVASSYDDQAQAAAILAAALYDAHRFHEGVETLDPWCERLDVDPWFVTPMTRVWVFNTAARSRVISGRAGWEELFRRSEEILRVWDPTELPRTWNYLAHGLLRHHRPSEARVVIDQIEGHPGLPEMSRWFLQVYRAEHARQCDEVWNSQEMEKALTEGNRVGHPFGFYLQATARQPGRAPDDAVARFRRAAQFFSLDAPSEEYPNIQHLLADCMRLGEAAWGSAGALWNEARDSIARRLRACPGSGLNAYYADVFEALGSSPDRGAAEAFLRRVPFF
jgi:hypothetical protein